MFQALLETSLASCGLHIVACEFQLLTAVSRFCVLAHWRQHISEAIHREAITLHHTTPVALFAMLGGLVWEG